MNLTDAMAMVSTTETLIVAAALAAIIVVAVNINAILKFLAQAILGFVGILALAGVVFSALDAAPAAMAMSAGVGVMVAILFALVTPDLMKGKQ